jgi:hypothetical protein
MAKAPRFRTLDVVRVEIDDPDAAYGADGRPSPDALILRLLRWQIDEGILPVRGTSYGSTRGHAADYSREDGARVLEWLTKNGARPAK